MPSTDPRGLGTLDARRLELVLRTIEADRRSAGPPQQEGTVRSDVGLSLGQERLWLAEQLAQVTAQYTMVLPLRLRGDLDVTSLSAALDRIVVRHEALRTTIVVRDGMPRGRVRAARPGALNVRDLRALPADERGRVEKQRILDITATHFDLREGPLIRAELLLLDQAESVLVAAVHHIAADNFSLSVLCRELSVFYRDPAAELPPPTPYSTSAYRQRAELAHTAERQGRYWQEQLAGSSVHLELPLDKPRPPVQSFRGRRVFFRLPDTMSEPLRRLQARHNVTPFMVLLTAFAVVLQRHTGQDDLVIGTDVANRTDLRDENVIGFFANQVVLRVQLGDDPSVQDALRRVRSTCLAAYENHHLPFQQLVHMLGRDWAQDRSPVFQVKLGHHQFSLDQLRLDRCEVTSIDVEGTAKFDLEVISFTGLDGCVQGYVEYATDLFHESTVARIADHLVDAVVAMMADDSITVLHLPLGAHHVTDPGEPAAPAETFDFE